MNTDSDMLRQNANEQWNVRGRPTNGSVEVSAGWKCEKRETLILTKVEFAHALEKNGALVEKEWSRTLKSEECT